MTDSPLDFTVIVPTFNRPDALGRCLSALAAQDLPRDRFEVFVVNDGGELSPRSVVDGYRSRLSIDLLEPVHGGPAHARNRGAERARGRFLAFTDDDCRPEPSWLSCLLAVLAAAPDRLVGGRIVNALPDNPFSSASQMIADVVYAHYNANPEEARFFSSNNMAVAADAYRSLGGFDEGFTILACEDRELCDRWRAAGRCMTYAHDAVVAHAHPLGLRTFVRQHFTYGRGALHFHRIRARRATGAITDEMTFHLNVGNWLLQPFRGRNPAAAAQIAALLLLWQSSNFAGFVYERLVLTGYRPGSSDE